MSWKIRDAILFLGGMVGVATFLATWVLTGRPSDPWLLAVFGAMLGLPQFIKADERRNNHDHDRDQDGDRGRDKDRSRR